MGYTSKEEVSTELISNNHLKMGGLCPPLPWQLKGREFQPRSLFIPNES